MIIRLIIIGLVFLAIIFLILVIGEILYWHEITEDEKSAEKYADEYERIEKFKQERKTMCLKSRHANVCPGVCNKCAWGDEIYEIREH